jgi:Flp pilus assembly protein TadG
MNFKGGLHSTRSLRFRRDERGAAQVEFALTILTMLVVVFMLMELCSAVYTYTVLSDAANEGLRYAIVHSSDPSFTASVENKITTYAANSAHDMSGMSIAVATPDGQTPPGRVQITVSYPYLPYTIWMASPPTMHAYAEGRMMY